MTFVIRKRASPVRYGRTRVFYFEEQTINHMKRMKQILQSIKSALLQFFRREPVWRRKLRQKALQRGKWIVFLPDGPGMVVAAEYIKEGYVQQDVEYRNYSDAIWALRNALQSIHDHCNVDPSECLHIDVTARLPECLYPILNKLGESATAEMLMDVFPSDSYETDMDNKRFKQASASIRELGRDLEKLEKEISRDAQP